MKQLLFSLLCGTALALAPAVQGAVSKGAPASQKGSDEQEELNYINIDLLHKALSGSEMHDETCLLFRYDSSDVIVLANAEKEVKFILIRTPEIKNKNKKREAMNRVKERVAAAFATPFKPKELISVDGRTALLYYDSLRTCESENFLNESRCLALQNLLSAYENSHIELGSIAGLACQFQMVLDGVEVELTLDLREEKIQYAEAKGGKYTSGFWVKPEEVIYMLFPTLRDDSDARWRAKGEDGEEVLRAVKTDGTYFMARGSGKKRGSVFIVGPKDAIQTSWKRKVESGRTVYLRPKFADFDVSLPASAIDNVVKPKPKPVKPAEPEKPKPKKENPTVEKEQPQAPTVEKEEPKPALPALTPEQAREAYLKMLREM